MGNRWSRGLAVLTVLAGLTADQAARAEDAGSVAIGEIATPPPGAGVQVALLRDVAEGQIKQLDTSTLPRRRFIVSLAVTGSSTDPMIACTVRAAVRDARTGNMLAIIEGLAQAQGPVSKAAQREVAAAAVRRAVRRIPDALAAH